MNEPFAQVSVRILDKEYQVACPASERTELLDSAEVLDAKMREIQNTGRIVGLDRIAVMAALNMAIDLLRAQARDRELDGDVSSRLKDISDRVESALGSARQLDLYRGIIRFGVSCGGRYGPGYLATLIFHIGAVICRSHLSRADSSVSLLRPRLAPPVAPVRERRSVTAQAGGASQFS